MSSSETSAEGRARRRWWQRYDHLVGVAADRLAGPRPGGEPLMFHLRDANPR